MRFALFASSVYREDQHSFLLYPDPWPKKRHHKRRILQPEFVALLARVIRPGGRIALLDVAEPPNPLVAFGHRIYFNEVVPRIGGLISDRDAYSYLPRSVAYLPPREELLRAVHDAGFTDVTHQFLSGGISQLIDPRGRIIAEHSVLEDPHQVLVGELPLGEGRSVYARIGDVFAWAVVVLLAGLLAFGRVRRLRAD